MREWKKFSWRDGSEPTGIFVLWEDEPSGGYEWEIDAIIGRKVGDKWEFAHYEDSGCSCNSAYEDDPRTVDFAWTDDIVTLTSSVRASLRNSSFRSSAEAIDAITSAMKFIKDVATDGVKE